MPLPVNAGAFVQVQIANAAGTLTDISGYVQSVEPHRSSENTDLTTFSAGGAAVTTTIVRGAAASEFVVKALYDPVLAKLLRQIIAARSGFTVQMRFGANAAPTSGDSLFSGTFTCLSYTLNYNTG